jgi:hypothetical protein
MMADRTAYSNSFGALAPVVTAGQSRALKALGGVVALLTSDLALNKTTALFKVPAGFNLVDMKGKIDDLDSGAGLVFAIGDAGSASRLLSGATTGQAGGVLGALAAGGVGYRYDTDTEIVFTATTAAGTAVAGNIALFLIGYLD